MISVILFFVALAAGWLAAFEAFGWPGLAIGFVCFLVVWLFAEVATGAVFYTYAELICESKPKDA